MRFLIALLFVLTSTIVPQTSLAQDSKIGEPQVQTPNASGSWEGAIQLPNGELGILVSLKAGDDGTWSGTIDIPTQALRGFDLSKISVEGRQVHFEMDNIPGQPTFQGELAEAGDVIAGSFQQGPQSLAFALRRSTEAPAQDETAAAYEAVPGEGMAGEWLGTLDVGPTNLRLVLRAEAKADGALSASIESVDQGATIPVDAIGFKEKVLNLSVQRIGGAYKGIMNKDGSIVVGSWSQGGRELPLSFHRLAEPFALNRPQNPKPPFPYDSQDITFENEADKIKLAGTLVVPKGEGPFPAVLMVTGSGPQDRDESLMGHKPFLVIADHLARKGIASLRYDDRGAGKSEGDHMGSTVRDFAADADAGIRFLAQQAKVDRKTIGIIGHSEGGLSGPIAAKQNEEVDFLVLLAPPGEPLRDLIVRQNEDSLRQQGVDEDLIERALFSQVEDFDILLDASLDREEAIDLLETLAVTQVAEFTEEERGVLHMNPAALEQGIRQMTTPWFRSLVQEDPATHLQAIKVPTLVLFGEKDFQVPPKFNAKKVESALAKAGNTSYDVRILPGLNHLFQHAKTGGVEEYGTIEETFSPEALEMISTWIRKLLEPPE